MHFLMLVTLTMPESASSGDVRLTAYTHLANDASFCGDGGRFGAPLGDWFVIGGCWSGYLPKTLLGDAYNALVHSEFPQMRKQYYPDDLPKSNGHRFDALWHQSGGSGPSPHTRNSYRELGYDDDAMLIDQAIYDGLLKPFENANQFGDGDHYKFVDLDDDIVNAERFVGHNKWIVVVDYHC